MSDYEKIQNLLAQYCFRVDTGTAEDITALFWDDAVLKFDGEHHGYAEILACYRSFIKTLREPVSGLRHLVYAPEIEICGDCASSRCYSDSDAHSARSGHFIHNRALLIDRLSKRGELWRFAQREIVWMRAGTKRKRSGDRVECH